MTTDFQMQDDQMFIFKNDNKTTDKQPTHKGQAKVGGKEYWVSCWVKTGKKGKFFSCAFTEKEDQPNQTSPNNMNTGSIDEDIPF